MFSLRRRKIQVLIIIALFLSAGSFGSEQDRLPVLVSKKVVEAHELEVKGDTLGALRIYKSLLAEDSIDTWKCRLLYDIASLEFDIDKHGNQYRQALDHTLKNGCDSTKTYEWYAFYFNKLMDIGLSDYSDSIITTYTKLIKINPNNGGYYYSRFLETYYTKGDTVSGKNDLIKAAELGDRVAIWNLKNLENKK